MSARETSSYKWADDLFRSSFASDIGFTQLLADEPHVVAALEYEAARERLATIHDFQERCISLFRRALSDNDSELLHWLLNETPRSYGLDYHRSLKDHHYTKPVFFRTDEIGFGKIAEIQCPGSLWGEMELMYQRYRQLGFPVDGSSPALQFATQLRDYLGAEPVVHYLVDNASIPAGVRYFIQQTRPEIRYWGIDRDVFAFRDTARACDTVCNFVRTHSFFGLCGDNFFRSRLYRSPAEVKYDFPPYVLFDQKATLVLPFWDKTRDYFTDEIRECIIYSAPICGDTIKLECGREISLKAFSELPQSERDYYIKYAGTDVSINWGSRAVQRLRRDGSAACFKRLEQCVSDYRRGKVWLIQKAVAAKHHVAYTERSGEQKAEYLNTKYSFFYGPSDLIGAVLTHSRRNIVHGQPDSVVNLLISEKRCDEESNDTPDSAHEGIKSRET